MATVAFLCLDQSYAGECGKQLHKSIHAELHQVV